MGTIESSLATPTKTERGLAQQVAMWSAALLFVAGVCTIFAAIWTTVAGYTPTPVSDQWMPLADLGQGKRFTSWSWLWQQHNEHRILLYRLSLFFDLRLFGGRSYLQFTLIYLVLILHWALWAGFFKTAANLPRSLWLGLSGFFAFCIFCPSQHENLNWAFQWTFIGAFVFASAAFISLGWLAGFGRPWHAIVASSIAAFLSEACLANGILTWPILWIGSMWLPLRNRQRLTSVGVGLAAMFLYLHNYQRPLHHSNPWETILQPKEIIRYLLTYFGFGLSQYVTYPGLLTIVLTVLGMLALGALLYRNSTRLVGVVLAMALCFLLGTGTITALGRIRFGLVQATASRYQSGVMVYWACIFAVLYLAIWERRWWRDLTALIIAGLCVIVLPIPDFLLLIDALRDRAVSLSLIGESLDQGVMDPSAVNTLGLVPPLMPWVTIATQYLHQVGLTAGPAPVRFSDSLLAAARDQRACVGYFDSATPVDRIYPGPTEVRAEGWAIDLHGRRPAPLIAVADQSGHVLSATAFHLSRPDVLAANPGSAGALGWRVYTPLRPDTRELRAFAIDNGQVCQVSAFTFHEIMNKASGKVLETPSASLGNSMPIQQGSPKEVQTQKWEIIPVDSQAFEILNVGAGKALDVTAQSKASGAKIQQFDYVGGENQRWILMPTKDGYYQIVNKGSGKVLDIAGKSLADGATMQQDDYIGSDSQQWRITPNFK